MYPNDTRLHSCGDSRDLNAVVKEQCVANQIDVSPSLGHPTRLLDSRLLKFNRVLLMLIFKTALSLVVETVRN